MIASLKKLFILLSILVANNVFAITGDNCACHKAAIKFSECQKVEPQSLTWWDWLTNNESTQLHFYQLIELLHTTDANANEHAIAVNQKKQKQDKL